MKILTDKFEHDKSLMISNDSQHMKPQFIVFITNSHSKICDVWNLSMPKVSHKHIH